MFLGVCFSKNPFSKAVHGDVSALSPGGVRVGAPVRDPEKFGGARMGGCGFFFKGSLGCVDRLY